MGVFNETIGMFLGPIKQYLEDESVSEVLVNSASEIFIERKGLLEKTDAKFVDEQALEAAVRNIAQYVKRTIDKDNPILDARLPDGERVAAVFQPCSRKGTTLSIRKFSKGVPSFVDLINRGSVSKEAARFLDVCIYLARNLIVSGGTGSGKTTLLNVLGGRIPKSQRLLVIEDATELKIYADHVVNFETKPASPDGKGEVTIRDLLRAALRLRPDRIIVGEVRGPEALDLVTAMSTGHGGSMGTVHANTPYDTLIRLETLSMMAGGNIPPAAIRRQISAAIHIVVQIKRFSDGTRKLSEISEVLPDLDERDRYQVHDIYKFVQRGKTAQGQVVGELVPTGYIPSFVDEIEINRLPFGREKFTPPEWCRDFFNKKSRQAA